MPAERFIQALNEQIAKELGASQHYLAVAVWYDNQTLPQLAKFFYAQAVEEREHALMMAKYLLDLDIRPRIPGVSEPRGDFSDFVEPIRVGLEQEKRVTDQIESLTRIAREEGDFMSEQFTHWFLKEQVEEIDVFSTLLDAAELARDRPLDLEEFIAREGIAADEGDDSTAPPVAGG